MDEQRVDSRAKTIEIRAKSKREFFLLHGYTGSPTDFNNLGKYLNERFNANVKIIRFKGHGEKIENLNGIEYSDFLLQAEEELKRDIAKGREIIIGGISMGAFIAMQLSTKYPVKGMVCVSVPYKYRLLAEIVATFEPIIFKKHWKKTIPDYEKDLRKNAFYYEASLTALRIVRQGRRQIKRILSKVVAPCLFVHVAQDKIFHPDGVRTLKEKIGSKIAQVTIFEENGKASHNPFYCPNHEKLYRLIGDFVEKNKLFGR